jgi:hypothetical protein
MDHFYDGQLRRYLTQFMRAMSGFGYKNNSGVVTKIPVIYGDMSRQAAQILKKNSENTVPTAPFISCYIKDVQFDQSRVQDPTFVKKYHIRERSLNPDTGEYTTIQGAGYTVETIMPSPYMVSFAADIWSTNTEQKLQIWEQIAVLFNPSLELQTNDNYLDWTSLSVLTLDSMVWSSRTIPQGVDANIDILNMTFKTPVWITPPAKVKQLGIITKIISNIHAVPQGAVEQDYSNSNAVYDFGITDSKVLVNPGNYDLLVLNNVATLVYHDSEELSSATTQPTNSPSWFNILDLYPGEFRANLSQLRLAKPDGNEVVARIRLDSANDTQMLLIIDQDTVPENSIIGGRTTIDAIINPETFNPSNPLPNTTYLILENININPGSHTFGYIGPSAWKNSNHTDFIAHANDIIQWDGSVWHVVFDSTTTTDVNYITNMYTGIQYRWNGTDWTKSFEGIYDRGSWRLIL